jgi:hypothetical protein
MGESKAAKTDKRKQFISGIQKHFKGKKTLTLKGKQVNLVTFVSGLQASIAARATAAKKRTAYLSSTKASREADAVVDPTMTVLSDYLLSTMSEQDLDDFGLKPHTRSVPTAATKAAAVQKRAATREARGTKGPKAKLKVVGSPSQPATPSQSTPPPPKTGAS